MVHVKKLVMQGFKSFVKKTEIPFTTGINVILGPNGSGKSNVSDALCFVLGRLSIKSMRAAKAKNLIFLGSKAASPAKEAIVEIIFDNEDNGFSIQDKEVAIKRIVRRNGQSIYKINGQTKTRQDVLALLAQAGIDPNGFNIILQGEIQNFVSMHTEERRKIIEEVSGISIYESRKKRSIRELEKTEEKLKEVGAILRERTSYLNNLEKERQQALRFQKLQKDEKKFKASIIGFDLNKKRRNLKGIEEEIEKRKKDVEKIKKSISETKLKIKNIESGISEINKKIQESAGVEQENLNTEIADLRADLAGLDVRRENSEVKIREIQKQKESLEEKISEYEIQIREIGVASPVLKNKEKELTAKKNILEELEEKRKKFYVTRSELKSLKERLEDKKIVLSRQKSESDLLVEQIEALEKELSDRNTTAEKVADLKNSLEEKKSLLEGYDVKQKMLERELNQAEFGISSQEEIISKIKGMDICPLCKSKITEEHIKNIRSEIDPRVEKLQKQKETFRKGIESISKKVENLKDEIKDVSLEISSKESDLLKISEINQKKKQIGSMNYSIKELGWEISVLENKRKNLEKNFDENSDIERRYEEVRIEVQEISLMADENLESEVSYKKRDLERSKSSLKQLNIEGKNFHEDLKELVEKISGKQNMLEKKNKQEEELNERFHKMISQRDELQRETRDNEILLSQKQDSMRAVEEGINNIKIDKARVGAEVSSLEAEMLEFHGVEIIGSRDRGNLVEKLEKIQDILLRIGSVNLRSLEVYDSVKKEYDSIHGRMETISKEKESILKIVHEIDIKKKKVFLKTLDELNDTFTRNFAQLSTKGQVTLELENRKDPFDGGVGIIVKTGHGKYFDVTSLSGGEQTLVALSLIFAIQELNPYAFYILDEIDAALDKRNSNRLAGLLQKYMQQGQYIVITHNDEVISNATNLFGISMFDGVSKLISLKV